MWSSRLSEEAFAFTHGGYVGNSLGAGVFYVEAGEAGEPAGGADPILVTTTSYGGVTRKTSPGYWSTGQTWIGNIEEIEAFIEENGTAFSLSEMQRAAEEDANGLKLWAVADAVTGATNSDFKDYFGLAQLAVGRLKMNRPSEGKD